ncbi:MAG: hypothetical protein LBH00_11235 [Planctomycetaceae bacterium]|jgi:hypothetical protein|nr:hypothetical protein [Planctomycetaceae bacterium]
MKTPTYRVVTRNTEGELRVRDYTGAEEICRRYMQIGVNDYSVDLSVRGCPVFKGLIGPMPETGGILRYESPDVFEQLTKEWSECRRKPRRSRKLKQNEQC